MSNTIDSADYERNLPAPWNILLPMAARIFVWGLLLSIVYLLRSFSLLIFLTFVFAYMQNYFVERLTPWVSKRWLRVVLVGIVQLAVIVGVITYLFPRVREQAEIFAGRHAQYLHTLDSQLAIYSQKYEAVGYMFPQLEQFPKTYDEAGLLMDWDLRTSVSATILQQLVGVASKSETVDAREVVQGLKGLVGSLLATGSSFLLSLLFSFLIVLDLPRLTSSVRELNNTKLRFIYGEVAGTIRNFASVVGAALVAQFFIAVLNTVLTDIGIMLLGLGQHMAFLSIIVFLCSFIPVAGVFISSAPICLLALEQGGVHLVLLSIILIWVIHLVEAYILNPQIYGNKLRVNPVLVLIILTVGGKLFGIWGLVLGLPVCTYIFGHAIRHAHVPTVLAHSESQVSGSSPT